MQALEIGHLGCVAGFNQGLKTGLDQLDGAATQHGLLAKQIGLGFFAKIGLNNAGLAATVGHGIAQGQVTRAARFVLVNGDQMGHATTLRVSVAHGVSRGLGRHHPDIQISARRDQAVMHVEAVRKHQ